MRSVLTVQTPATGTSLTTLAAVKADLGITDTSEDAYLTAQIPRASSAICGMMNVRSAGGVRTIGSEALAETFMGPRTGDLVLSRLPVTAVSSVVDCGTTLDPSAYQIDEDSGILRRLDCHFGWRIHHHYSVVVNYTAGWILTDDSSRDLPSDIEFAAILWIKAQRFARQRDPALQRDQAEGIGYLAYDTTPATVQAAQSAIQALLAPWTMPTL